MWSTEAQQWDHEQGRGEFYRRPMHMWQSAGIYVTQAVVACAAAGLVLQVHRDREAKEIEII